MQRRTLAFGMLPAPSLAFAREGWPSRQFRIVIGWLPGRITDVMAGVGPLMHVAMVQQGMDVLALSGEGFANFAKAETERRARVVRANNLRLEA